MFNFKDICKMYYDDLDRKSLSSISFDMFVCQLEKIARGILRKNEVLLE